MNWTNLELCGCDESNPLHKRYVELALDAEAIRLLREKADELGRPYEAAFRDNAATADGREYFEAVVFTLEQELEFRERLAIYLEAIRQQADESFQAARNELATIEAKIRDEMGLRPEEFIPPAARQVNLQWRRAMLATLDNGGWHSTIIRKHALATADAQKQLEQFRALIVQAERKAKHREAIATAAEAPKQEPWYRTRGRELAEAAKQLLAKASAKSKR